jgi:GxxExxY protein
VIEQEKSSAQPLKCTRRLDLACSNVAYRVDFLVEDVVVEIKSVEAIDPIYIAQLMTYMKVGQWKLGLLINFNVTALTRGIRRIAM